MLNEIESEIEKELGSKNIFDKCMTSLICRNVFLSTDYEKANARKSVFSPFRVIGSRSVLK